MTNLFHLPRTKDRPQTQDDPFYTAFRGSFTSLMQWGQLDAFWDTVRAKADAGWYVYCIGETAPTQPLSATQVQKFLKEVDVLLHRDHDEGGTGETLPRHYRVPPDPVR